MQQVHELKQTRAFPSFAQIRHINLLLVPKERRIFLGGLVVFFCSFLLCIVSIFLAFVTLVPKSGGTLTEGMLGFPQFINPLYAEANIVDKDISTLVYSGLLAFNPTTQTFEPDLAQTWSRSDDEKIYTITLKEHVTWHDGEPLSVQDVLFTFQALQNPAYASPLYEAYQGIAVAVIDDKTLTFTLPEPYAPFPELLTVGILPAHLWENIAPENARFVALNEKPLGTGPYVFNKTSKDSNGTLRTMTFEAYDHYHGTHPYIQEIVLKFFANRGDIVHALQTKRIDITAALEIGTTRTLSEDSALRVTSMQLFQYIGAFFNTNKQPLTETHLRDALAQSLDIPALTAEATAGFGTAQTFTLPGFPSTPIPTRAENPYTLFAEAGWTLQDDGKLAKNEQVLQLLIVTAERKELRALAEAIAKTWQDLGINATVSIQNASDLSRTLQEKTYDVFIAGEQYGSIADPYPFWHSSQTGSQGVNMSQFSSLAADTAIATLRTSANPDKRQEAFRILSEELQKYTPAVFFFQNSLPLVHTVDVQGITPATLTHAAARFQLLPSWYKRTGFSWHF